MAWEGDVEGLHSLAIVNRALCTALIERGHDLGLVSGSNGQHAITPERVPLDPRLAARLGRGPEGGPAQVYVRHQWPPNFRAATDRPVGADAAVGVRQLAQGLAANAAASRRGLGL